MYKTTFKELIKVAYPLMLTSSTFIIMSFIDRLFLSWHSQEEIAACTTAGLVSFTIVAFFVGVATYVETFVAQYYGAKRYNEIGKILWQGFYFAIVAGVLSVLLIPLTREIFTLSDHSALIQIHEKNYFTILQLGLLVSIVGDVAMGFFAGRGKSKIIFYVIGSSVILNGILDYLLIFGKFGFPELGIVGAGIATVMAISFRTIVFIIMLLRKKYREKYAILKDKSFDLTLFKRLIKFGAPFGLQFFLDHVAFTIFFLLIGRIGDVELAVSNIAITINMVAYIPIGGLHWAVVILVGQYVGKSDFDTASRITKSAFILTFIYIGLVSLSFVAIPDIYLNLFEYQSNQDFSVVLLLGRKILILLAIYSIVDAAFIIFIGALKGAGDTKFTMYVSVLCSWILFIPLVYISVEMLHLDVIWCWIIASIWVIVMGIIVTLRYLSGKWKEFDVIGRNEGMVA